MEHPNLAADAVARALEALGVRTVFGIVSVHNLPTYDALARSGIDIVACRHEQAATHAADAYARCSGDLGVVLASTGPGTTNTVTGLYEAAFASSPVLLVTGQVDRPDLGRGLGVLHEADRQREMLASLCRRTETARWPDEAAPAVYLAGLDAQRGRPQPTAVELPIDVQYATAPAFEPWEPPPPPAPSPDAVARAAELVSAARRRVLWAGGGVHRAGAADLVTTLAEQWETPVITSINGRGAIDETHPLAVGPFGSDRRVRAVLADADLVVAVGTRFQRETAGGRAGGWTAPLIHIDADPSVIGRIHPAEVAVVGDARLGLTALRDAVGDVAGNDPTFNRRLADAAAEAREAVRIQSGPDHTAICEGLAGVIGSATPVVRDSTVPAYLWGNRLLPVRRQRRSVHPTSAAIGPGLPFAIGAAVATGEPTLALCGDGGLMLHVGELATVADRDLPVAVVVFNDRGYGVLRAIQDLRMGGRRSGVDLATPDFAALAEATGLRGVRARTPAGVVDAVAEAFADRVPTVIDTDMGAMERPDLFRRA